MVRRRFSPISLIVVFLLFSGITTAGDLADLRARAAMKSLSGLVVANGVPAAGAVVAEATTGEVVIADANGRFVLSNLPKWRATLVVAYGGESFEVPYSSTNGRSRGVISIDVSAPGGSPAAVLPIARQGRNQFHGPITSINAAAGTFSVNDRVQGTVQFKTNGSTIVRNANAVVGLGTLKAGTNVLAKTSSPATGTLLATEVDVEDGQGDDGQGDETQVEGTVTAFDCTAGTMTVTTDDNAVVNVTFQVSTTFETNDQPSTCSGLALGDHVEVSGAPQTDGSILASNVSFEAPEVPETEISGTVKSFDCTAGTMVVTTASGDVNVSFQTTTVFETNDDQTSTCASLAVGDDVEVKGTSQTDGSILASKVKFETPENENVDIQGTVKSVSAPNFVVTTESGDVTVVTDGTTVFSKDDDGTASFTDIVVGANVEAEGALQSDGSVLAANVQISSGDQGGDGGGDD